MIPSWDSSPPPLQRAFVRHMCGTERDVREMGRSRSAWTFIAAGRQVVGPKPQRLSAMSGNRLERVRADMREPHNVRREPDGAWDDASTPARAPRVRSHFDSGQAAHRYVCSSARAAARRGPRPIVPEKRAPPHPPPPAPAPVLYVEQ